MNKVKLARFPLSGFTVSTLNPTIAPDILKVIPEQVEGGIKIAEIQIENDIYEISSPVSNVEVVETEDSGIKIANIKINGDDNELYIKPSDISSDINLDKYLLKKDLSSKISVDVKLDNGVNIADVKVNNKTYKLYAPEGSTGDIAVDGKTIVKDNGIYKVGSIDRNNISENYLSVNALDELSGKWETAYSKISSLTGNDITSYIKSLNHIQSENELTNKFNLVKISGTYKDTGSPFSFYSLSATFG